MDSTELSFITQSKYLIYSIIYNFFNNVMKHTPQQIQHI